MGAGIALVVIGIGAAAMVGRSSNGTVETGPLDDGAAPAPIFADVTPLVPTSLPDGWSRCSGAPSGAPEATGRWWSQRFGPVTDGGCDPVVVVTQIPPDEEVEVPPTFEEGKLGDADVMRWSGPGEGSLSLFTWAVDQHLLVEACCGAVAEEHLDAVAAAALDGTRDVAPARCTNPASDLGQETLVENLTGKAGRMVDGDGCPIRSDIASMETLPEGHHCWPGVTILRIGTPLGASRHDTDPRVFVRDPEGQLAPGPPPDPDLDLDARLPPTALDTGYSRDGRALWVDEADDARVFVVDGDRVEAWPRDLVQ